MEVTTLQKLPKDMLVKIIMTIQDVKTLNDEQLEETIQTSLKEMEKRKLLKLKSLLLQHSSFQECFNVAETVKTVRLIRLKDTSDSRIEIIFEDGIEIKVDTRFLIHCGHIFNNRGEAICNVTKETIFWEDKENDKYDTYINFTRDVVFHAYHEVCYYLDPLTEINEC